jgi:hypothetical protein
VFQEVLEHELGDEVHSKELYSLPTINDLLSFDPSQTTNQTIAAQKQMNMKSSAETSVKA